MLRVTAPEPLLIVLCLSTSFALVWIALCINEATISIKFHVRNAIAVGHITFGGDSEGTSKMGGTFFEEI